MPEQTVIARFLDSAIQYIPAHYSYWERLYLARHFGVPTRLLDWSFSPLVALFFATDPNFTDDKENSVIYQADPFMINLHFPAIKAKFPGNGDYLSTAQLGELAQDVDSLNSLVDRSSGSTEEHVFFVEPTAVDMRIVAQNSIFSIATSPTADHGRLIPDNHIEKIVIEPGVRAAIRALILRHNITKALLYPGIEGVAQHLKDRHFFGFP